MIKKKIAGLLVVVALTTVLFAGCSDVQSTDSKQADQTEQLQKQAQSKLGMPNIRNFYEKETLKTIMEQCDNSKLITYTYIKNDMTGKLVFLGESMGYGIPYGTEYTNPQAYQGNGVSLPQADPNGLYKDSGVSATWVMLIDSTTGKASPLYEESDITVSQFKLPAHLCDPTSLPSDY